MDSKQILHIITGGESETVEFKRIWKDEYLKTLCAFANTIGGILFIGVDDIKTIVGVKNASTLLEILPNKISDNIGITPSVQITKLDNNSIIQVKMNSSFAPISYHGKFYIRSGSVTRELRAGELNHFLLKRYGKTWDEIPADNFTIEDIDEKTIEKFKNLASDRIPGIQNEKDTSIILRKLNLYDGDVLKRAAVLLFAKEPQKYFIQSHSKIGRFLSETDILTSDFIEGNLIDQVDTILGVLRTKYLKSYINFEGIHRREKLEYPYEALKEAIINALIHRDYTNTSNLQIKVYGNKLTMTNGALLPPEITIEKLKQSHASIPANPLIAAIFYKAGLIENWGRGTINMVNDCINYKISEPEFKFDMNIFWTTFYNNVPDNVPDNRLERIITLIGKNNKILLQELSDQLNVSKRTIRRDIEKLKIQNILERIGDERTGYWEVINND